MNSELKQSDIKHLLVAEKKLLEQRKWIEETLHKIKSQRIALQVERLQLQSLNAHTENTPKGKIVNFSNRGPNSSENNTLPSKVSVSMSNITSAELLDQAESSCNRKALDLRIMADLDNILSGKYCCEDSSEESSEEEWKAADVHI